jgi:hypothetical protein
MLFQKQNAAVLKNETNFFVSIIKKLPQKDKKVGDNPIEEIQS